MIPPRILGITSSSALHLDLVSAQVFAVPSESGQDEIACGLYLEAATVNHSCAPNAVQTFHGRQLSLRCIRPILPGEEVMIGVTDLRLPGPERRQALSANFFFECRCERCHSQDAPSMDALLEGYACPDASCAGLCAKRESHIELEDESIRGDAKTEADACLMATGSTLSCDRCGALRPAGEAATGSAVIRNLLEQGKSCASQHGDYARARGYLEKAHQQATSSSGHRLHRANWILSEIYSQLVRVTLNLQVIVKAEHDPSSRVVRKVMLQCLSTVCARASLWRSCNGYQPVRFLSWRLLFLFRPYFSAQRTREYKLSPCCCLLHALWQALDRPKQ